MFLSITEIFFSNFLDLELKSYRLNVAGLKTRVKCTNRSTLSKFFIIQTPKKNVQGYIHDYIYIHTYTLIYGIRVSGCYKTPTLSYTSNIRISATRLSF